MVIAIVYNYYNYSHILHQQFKQRIVDCLMPGSKNISVTHKHQSYLRIFPSLLELIKVTHLRCHNMDHNRPYTNRQADKQTNIFASDMINKCYLTNNNINYIRHGSY